MDSRAAISCAMAFALGAMSLLPVTPSAPGDDRAAAPRWEKLPALPDREGFAGSFAGESGGVLIVAGGANFPDKRPWQGGAKRWYDSAFALEGPDARWRSGFRLPRPIAYGVSVTTPRGVLCIGGGDARQHYRDVFLLRWTGATITTTAMPPLPGPCAFMCGAAVGDVVYVVGGIETPDATACLNTLRTIDPSQAQPRWRELEPLPGPARILAVAGAARGGLFIFSGAALSAGADGKPVREYLRDAWRYAPDRGWKRLAEMPRPAVAAPSPAPLLAGDRLLVVSGDDGARLGFKPETQHPGFPRDVLAYDVAADAWSRAGEAPFSLATAPIAPWRDRVVIAGGEERPGYRSPGVWAFQAAGRP